MGVSKKIAPFLFAFVMASTGLLVVDLEQSGAQNEVLYGVNSKVNGLFSIGSTKLRRVNLVGRFDSDNKERLNSYYVTPSAMAMRPSDGALFVWNNTGKDHGKTIHTGVLLEVDKCDGSASLVGPKKPQGLELKALTFGPNGILYGLNDSLYQIDTDTGKTTAIGSPSSWFYWRWLRIGAADFDPVTGTLYAVERRYYDSQRIVTVNTNNGEVIIVGKVSEKFAPIGSIVFTPESTIIGSGGEGFLFEIDTTGKTLKTWNIKSKYVPQGMAFAPSCERQAYWTSSVGVNKY